MTMKWGGWLILLGCVALTGCRTPQPNLKPPKTAEILTDPTRERRYEVAEYPKAALDQPQDPTRLTSLDKQLANGGGGRGSGMGMGGMGMGGGGMGGGGMGR